MMFTAITAAADKAIAKDIEALKKLNQGDYGIASRTKDNSKWIVAYNRDSGPPRYGLWNRPYFLVREERNAPLPEAEKQPEGVGP